MLVVDDDLLNALQAADEDVVDVLEQSLHRVRSVLGCQVPPQLLDLPLTALRGERDREREREGDSEREGETERKRERDRKREETARERERNRGRQRERGIERERQKKREGQRFFKRKTVE